MAKVHIENVFKNMRYKILLIGNTYYIVEITPSFWKILCPFLYWFSSFTIYKIEDRQTIERLKAPNNWVVKHKVGLPAGGFSVLAAYYLRFLTESLTVEQSFYLKMTMLFFAVLCVVVIRLYLNRVKRKVLCKMVHIEELETYEVEVKPQSWKHIFQMVCIYMFFLLLTVLFYWGYIASPGNILALLMASVMVFLWTLVCNIAVKEGWTPVKFTNKIESNK